MLEFVVLCLLGTHLRGEQVRVRVRARARARVRVRVRVSARVSSLAPTFVAKRPSILLIDALPSWLGLGLGL
jgi:hypothetical protein